MPKSRADRRMQVVRKGQDHGVDVRHRLAIIPEADGAEAVLALQIAQPRRLGIAQRRQFHRARGQHRGKMRAFRDGSAADDADAHRPRPPEGLGARRHTSP